MPADLIARQRYPWTGPHATVTTGYLFSWQWVASTGFARLALMPLPLGTGSKSHQVGQLGHGHDALPR